MGHRDRMDLTGKYILITGGNSGIGLQLARQLHAKRNHVIVVSRTRTRWHELQALQPELSLLQCDLADQGQVLETVQHIKKQWPTLDVLINCAAIQNTPMLIEPDFRVEDIAPEVTINFIAPVWLCSLLLPDFMSRAEAAIVNLLSGLAFYPKTSSAIYCATKAALHSFSQSLRYQLAGSTVSVMEVILPLVDTPMTRGRGKGKLSPSFAAQQIIAGIERNTSEIYVGKARLLPAMLRISPGLVKHILQRY